MNAVAIVVNVDDVPADICWRELGGEAQMNVACHSHRQFTVGTADADSQLCGSATRNLRERRGCTVLKTCSHVLAFSEFEEFKNSRTLRIRRSYRYEECGWSVHGNELEIRQVQSHSTGIGDGADERAALDGFAVEFDVDHVWFRLFGGERH